eukprot:251263_1
MVTLLLTIFIFERTLCQQFHYLPIEPSSECRGKSTIEEISLELDISIFDDDDDDMDITIGSGHRKTASGVNYAVDLDQINKYLTYFEAQDQMNNIPDSVSMKPPIERQMSDISNFPTLTYGHSRDSYTIGSHTLNVHNNNNSLILLQPTIHNNDIDLYDNEHRESVHVHPYHIEHRESIQPYSININNQINNIPTQPSMNAPKPMWKQNTQMEYNNKPLPQRYNQQPLPPPPTSG